MRCAWQDTQLPDRAVCREGPVEVEAVGTMAYSYQTVRLHNSARWPRSEACQHRCDLARLVHVCACMSLACMKCYTSVRACFLSL